MSALDALAASWAEIEARLVQPEPPDGARTKADWAPILKCSMQVVDDRLQPLVDDGTLLTCVWRNRRYWWPNADKRHAGRLDADRRRPARLVRPVSGDSAA